MSTPAYQYGEFLGRMKASMEQVGQQIAAGFASMQKATQRSSEAMREVESERRYRANIARERRLGREYVTQRCNQLRKDLGLS